MPFNFIGDTMRIFLGLPPRRPIHTDLDDENPNSIWNYRDEDELPNHNNHNERNIDLFNESHEIHRIFEQFNDIFKLFNMDIGEASFGENNDFFEDNRQIPAQRSIRDEYLKPGYHKKSTIENNKIDSDVDGVIAPNDLNKFFGESSNQIKPYEHNNKPNVFSPNGNFFGRVVITQTTTKPDGTIETRRTVRDSRNNEETTITVRENDSHPNDTNIFNPNGSMHPNDPLDIWGKFFGRNN